MKIRIVTYLVCFLLGVFSWNQNAFCSDSIGRRIENGKIVILHKVESKQTVFAISQIYGVSAEIIYHDNPTAKLALKVGQILKVRTEIEENASVTAVVTPTVKTHKVELKETMYSVSKLYNVSVDEIKQWNNLTTNELSLGQVLNINKTNTIEAVVENKVVPTEKAVSGKTHAVEPQQTLYAISKLYNASVEDLKKWNNLTTNDVSTGQILKITGVKSPVTTTPVVTTPVVAKKENSNFNPDSKFHTVAKGETLFALSKLYNVPINDIAEWNNLTSNSLTEGQLLIINGEKNTGGSAMDALVAVNTEEKKQYIKPTNTTTIKNTTNISNTTSNNNVKLKDQYQLASDHSEKQKVEAALALSQQHLDDHSVQKKQYESSLGENKAVVVTKSDKDLNHWFVPNQLSSYEDTIKYGVKSLKRDVGQYKKIVETGVCELIEDNHWDSKYNALHPSAPLGTIIQVRNPENDISVFVRVVGRLVETSENKGDVIKISHHAVERLAPDRSRFPVQIFYLP